MKPNASQPMNPTTDTSAGSRRDTRKTRCHLRWLVCILALFTFLGAPPSAKAQSFPQTFIANSDGCNWPYSAVASNSANEIFAFCRTAADTFNLLKWNGSAWVTQSTFTATQVKPGYISLDDVWLTIDSTGAFHVVVSLMDGSVGCCSQRRGVFYGKSTTGATWTFTEIETFTDPSGFIGTDEPVVRVDPSNNPHVAFLKTDANGGRSWTLRYWKFNGSTWSGSNAFTEGGNVNNEITAMNFDLDTNGKAHFAFQYETNGSGLDGGLWYIDNTSGSFPGTATELIHGAQGAVTGGTAQIRVDAANKSHIISRGPGTAIQYTTDASGSFVSTQVNGTLTGGLIRHSFHMNANGDKLIVHKPAAAPFDIKYAYQKAGESCWTLGDAFLLGTFTSAGGPPYAATITNNRKVMLLTDVVTGSCSVGNPRQLYSATSDFSAVSCGGPVTTAPTVTTAAQSGVTHNSATLGGDVTADGGASVTDRGIVWGLASNPTTTADTKVANGSGTGAFSATVNGLPPGTLIHVRAYATNSVSTSYGTDISFNTLPAVAVSSLNRNNTTPSNASFLNWTLTFASPVTGLTASNFTLSGAAAAGSTVISPGTSNAGLTWTIPVNTGSTDGTLTLNLANSTGLSSAISTTLPFAGESYTMDKSPPTVLSVVRLNPGNQTTNLTTVTFRVTYSEPVTLNNPETARFRVVPVNSNIVGTVTGVTGTGDKRDVTVNITSGTGEFKLRVLD